jgi:hypothetical protein
MRPKSAPSIITDANRHLSLPSPDELSEHDCAVVEESDISEKLQRIGRPRLARFCSRTVISRTSDLTDLSQRVYRPRFFRAKRAEGVSALRRVFGVTRGIRRSDEDGLLDSAT